MQRSQDNDLETNSRSEQSSETTKIRLPGAVLGTIMSFTVHGQDIEGLDEMRKVSAKVRDAIDCNQACFEQDMRLWFPTDPPILEVRGHANSSLNGVWYFKSRYTVEDAFREYRSSSRDSIQTMDSEYCEVPMCMFRRGEKTMVLSLEPNTHWIKYFGTDVNLDALTTRDIYVLRLFYVRPREAEIFFTKDCESQCPELIAASNYNDELRVATWHELMTPMERYLPENVELEYQEHVWICSGLGERRQTARLQRFISDENGDVQRFMPDEIGRWESMRVPVELLPPEMCELIKEEDQSQYTIRARVLATRSDFCEFLDIGEGLAGIED